MIPQVGLSALIQPLTVISGQRKQVCSRDKPQLETEKVISLIELELKRELFTTKFRLKAPSFTMFLYIVSDWLINKRGNTVYSICVGLGKEPDNSNMSTYDKIQLLIAKGLVEVIEKRGNSLLYAPTNKGLTEFRFLLGEL